LEIAMATRQPTSGYPFVRLVLTLLVLCSAPAFGQATLFVAGPAVSLLDYGAIANDLAEDTPALIAAMAGGGRTVRIPAGEYRIGKLEIPSNTVWELAPGVVLRDTGQLGLTDRLITIASQNVRIVGNGSSVVANRAVYTTGEFRHGIFIRGATNVHIIGLRSSEHGGDGFYLGTGTRDVTIESSGGNFNRRQGMSIVAGVNVLVRDCLFTNTSGTPPSLGVDIEPNNNSDILQSITLQNVRTSGNAGGGISVRLSAYTAAAPPARILISGHVSTNERPTYSAQSLRAGVDRVTYLPVLSAPR
jgi:hypothetical protein